jgi:multicomponent Na+:H+ antiporter subunit E
MSDNREAANSIAAYIGAFGFRFALLALLWWALTEASGGWYFGLPVAALGTAVSLWLTPPARHTLHVHRIPVFTVYFMLQSLRAGWDVARRTLSPQLPLRPGFVRLQLRLPAGAPTWWLMITLSLLPGTLSVCLDRRALELHCLDTHLDVVRDVRAAEAQLAALFGHRLVDAKEDRQ